MAGEPQSDSVRKLQLALQDLGYYLSLINPVDGIFGPQTGEAVVAFKHDHGLQPADPVIGKGTMAALDAYFVAEPADPDAPDPSIAGLAALADDSITNFAVPWLTAATTVLQQWPPGEVHPEDPAWVAFDAALERNFQLSTYGAGREILITRILLPVYKALSAAFGSPRFVTLEELDQATSVGIFGRPYSPISFSPGAVFHITPPSRNAMTAEERAVAFISAAVRVVHPAAVVAGLPGTPRYSKLTGDVAQRNRVAYAAFAFETATSLAAQFAPLPAWL
jgi:peptidoglycan hydrolase-like protein with peptidoglycan-binding domain